MASETVASPMRLATAPGRLARPAPPGNDDPCEERRTIPEGMPRLPREAWTQVSDGRFRILRSFGEGGRTTASTGPGQKSHVERRKASVPVAGLRRTSRHKPARRFVHID